MTDDADSITQRNALERARADGRREALGDVLLEIDKLGSNELYRKAGKRISIAVTRLLKSVNARLTQA